MSVSSLTGAANFIAGEWVPSRSGLTSERHGPWRPAEVVAEVPRSDPTSKGARRSSSTPRR